MNRDTVVLTVFLIINITGFLIQYIDKSAARHNRRRVPERNLWLIGICFGATGSYFGMKAFHHKTKHKNFMIGMPVLALLQIAVLTYTYFLTH